MMRISLCMIVKNESHTLARCLDSLKGLFDQTVIVDTGSTDDTREIAARYTDEIYDFTWQDDFAAARNFAFSKCTCDYIYSADADEVLDEKNRRRFSLLKEALLPEVEIVQMKYLEPHAQAVMNATAEYRPKLFRRLRTFTWIDPVHESVRLDPVVFNSDIEILHLPEKTHTGRDFSLFEKAFQRDGTLSKNLCITYAKELLKWGNRQDFAAAADIFQKIEPNASDDPLLLTALFCTMAHSARLGHRDADFIKYTAKLLVSDPCSEICCELGEFFLEKKDYSEAAIWFCNAAFETHCSLDVHRGGDLPLRRLSECYAALAVRSENDPKQAASMKALSEQYDAQAKQWVMPEGDR